MKKKMRLNEKGQALTEFVLICALFLFLILMHFQLSMNYVSSSYIHYASYMTARTNMVSGEDRARVVAESLLGSPGNSTLEPFAHIDEINIGDEGVSIRYHSPLYVPIIRLPFGENLNLKFDTLMKKEPNDCDYLEHDNGC